MPEAEQVIYQREDSDNVVVASSNVVTTETGERSATAFNKSARYSDMLLSVICAVMFLVQLK